MQRFGQTCIEISPAGHAYLKKIVTRFCFKGNDPCAPVGSKLGNRGSPNTGFPDSCAIPKNFRGRIDHGHIKRQIAGCWFREVDGQLVRPPPVSAAHQGIPGTRDFEQLPLAGRKRPRPECPIPVQGNRRFSIPFRQIKTLL